VKTQNKDIEEGEEDREHWRTGGGPHPRSPALLAALMAVLIATVLVVAGCAQSDATPPATDSGGDGTVRVAMVDMGFDPETVTVRVGQSVTWVNEDSVSHNAVADDGSWKTEIFADGGSVTLTFDTPGTYAYRCTPHPAMKGTVIVE